MKHTVYLLAVALLLMATACRNGNTNVTDDDSLPKGAEMLKGDGVTRVLVCGEVELMGLTDVENEMPADLFRGSYDDGLLDSLAPTGGFRSAINAFLMKDSLHTVLFDAGLGADRGGRLLERMARMDVDPSEVTDVCLTHLHADHIGGLLLDGKAAFPNATLHLSLEEFDAWGDGGPMAAQNGLWKQVMEAYRGRIEAFRDGARLFGGLVVAELAPGHTPGHTVFHVGDLCLVAGDLLHAQDLQLDYPQFCARYDHDPAQATATRIRVLDALRNGGGFLAAAHCHDHLIDLKRVNCE